MTKLKFHQQIKECFFKNCEICKRQFKNKDFLYEHIVKEHLNPDLRLPWHLQHQARMQAKNLLKSSEFASYGEDIKKKEIHETDVKDPLCP